MLRLYADECADARIVAGLRRRGLNVLTAADENLLGAADASHLERARALERVVLSSDGDFLRMAHERTARGQSHPGLLFILPMQSVGDVVRAVGLLAEVLDPEDMLIANRRPNRRGLLGRLALVFAMLLFVSGPVGIALGLFTGLGDVGGEPVDASQKVRILAEPISEFINVAFAVLALGIPAVTAFVLFRRSRAEPVSGFD